jgi:SET domain
VRKVPTHIGDAGAKGKGVFASGLIKRSTVIGGFRGRPRWIWDIPGEVWPYTIQVDYDRYVVPRRKGVVWYLNHSCEPNCCITGKNLVAARDIEEGEELTFDYSSDVDWPGFRMLCSCGAHNCRKTIRAYRYLPAKVKLRYGRHVAPFILREYFQGRVRRRPGQARAPGPVKGEPAGRRAALRSP